MGRKFSKAGKLNVPTWPGEGRPPPLFSDTGTYSGKMSWELWVKAGLLKPTQESCRVERYDQGRFGGLRILV